MGSAFPKVRAWVSTKELLTGATKCIYVDCFHVCYTINIFFTEAQRSGWITMKCQHVIIQQLLSLKISTDYISMFSVGTNGLGKVLTNGRTCCWFGTFHGFVDSKKNKSYQSDPFMSQSELVWRFHSSSPPPPPHTFTLPVSICLWISMFRSPEQPTQTDCYITESE